ncbi:D-alanyl-D-alanine carboxypeptidase/D-alanyl-D-alanine-endopeptidase [Vulgatibacter sp.]|uniref:D-alanyl-D-alanine carboxypeptidase/D-alanyl-D-alanine endopeptidase n=1 Tax=Vulgatibacter sp. TaxID=1971226 RepID=UPI003563CCC1
MTAARLCRPAGCARWLAAALLLFLLVGQRPARAAVPEERELREAVERILDSTPLGRARTGVLIYDLETKRPVYEHNADELLNPASNMKILTTVAALSRLGPGFRYATEFYVDQEPVGGVVQGNLYVRGKGDPSLDTERLYRIVRQLRLLGLLEVKGSIVVDDTWFDPQYDGPGWEQDDSDRPYMAGAGAVSLNFNAVAVHVHPAEKVGARARVELDPASDYLVLENHGVTTPARSRRRIAVQSLDEGKRQRIVVDARMPAGRRGGPVWRRVSNPPIYAGETLKAMLGEQGIKVRGKVRLGKVPDRLRTYFVDWSEPLAVLVHTVNKWSQNHMSEMLLKTLGAEVEGAPGTWAKGVSVVEDVLAGQAGIPRGSFVMKNGSGLNDTNRISARQIVRVLAWARQELLVAPELLTSLPVAGVDGTVRNRMGGTPAQGRIRAKTGTLQNVTALSGYATSVGGRELAFAVLVNDYPGRLSRVIPGVDAIGAAVATVDVPGGGDAAVALAQPPAWEPKTPIDVLGARMVTYHNLGKAADARNGLMLRTALRSEPDPAVRAVVAEALHLSEPEDGSARVAVLEAFSAAPEVYGRLREAAERVSLPLPLVNTLVDLAADGSADALGLLLGLAAQRPEDEVLLAEVAVGLAEVGSAAPGDLLAALNGASGETQAVAVQLLGRALASPAAEEAPTPEPKREIHPFKTALASAAEGQDPVLATFARSLESRLTASIAAAASTAGGALDPEKNANP